MLSAACCVGLSVSDCQPPCLWVAAATLPLFLVVAKHFLQLPSVDEISAHMSGTMLTTIVFFLDETFEEVSA